MLPNRLPKAILFDLMDTLLDETYLPEEGIRAMWPFLHAPGGLNIEILQAETERIYQERIHMCRTLHFELPIETYLRQIYEGLGCGCNVDISELTRVFWDAAIRLERPEPGIPDLLDTIDQLGIQRAVVSNLSFPSYLVDEALERHGLGGFAFRMVSVDYGIRKPNLDFYRIALTKLGLLPDDVWYAGDRWVEDVSGPTQVGMFPVWYRRKMGNVTLAHRPMGDPVDCLEIHHWDELAAMLHKLAGI